MQVGDRAHLAEIARQSIQAQAAHLPDLELRTITVPESGNAGTQLFAAIDRALADIPRSRLAGTIAITDGQIHDVPKAAPGGAPLNLLLTGKGEETDRRLRVIEAPGYGIVGKSVTLRVAIDDLGTNGHTGPATLTVRRDGQLFRTESVPVGTEQRIEIPITRAGPTVIEMAASPLPGEVSQLNNRAVVEINGVRDRLRVLLISGEPHQGERTWRRLLKADPVGRSGAFHHSAAAREGRPHAAERARADRLPGPRAVRRQDRRVRPDHPRPVPESRPAAAALPGATSPTACARAARC